MAKPTIVTKLRDILRPRMAQDNMEDTIGAILRSTQLSSSGEHSSVVRRPDGKDGNLIEPPRRISMTSYPKRHLYWSLQ